MSRRLGRRDFMKSGVAAIGAAATFSQSAARAEDSSSALYFNGTILTMEGDAPQYAEAVAVKDGRIAFVGSRAAAQAAVPGAAGVDLKGRTLLPGFIDTWGHFTLFAQQTLGVNLGYFAARPPRSKAEAIALLKAGTPLNGWIMGNSYNAPQLTDGGLTLADLDAAFPDVPVMIATLATLTGQVNSAGLAKLGITPDTKAASPGIIVKDPKTGKLTGDLLFTPFLDAQAVAIGKLPQAEVLKTFKAAEALLAAQGYTTVQSYQVQASDVANFRTAFDQGVLSIDVIGLPSITDEASGNAIASGDWAWGSYSHGDRGFKVPGFMVSTDAAPQLRLAAFTQPYADTTGFPDGWKGLLLPQEMVEHWIGYAYAKNIQLFGYSNGDAGIDLSLAAIRKAIAASGKGNDRRTIIAHSYYVRQDQLETYRDLDIGASMMLPHMMVYGEEMVRVLGPERANRESPVASALKAGVRTTLHCDCPSASPSVMEAIGGAVTRRTFSGQVLGPEEAVAPYDALVGFTRGAAYVYREEAVRGTITAGKFADLVILDQNPLTVAPDAIGNIKVVETVKRGKTVFRRA
ncbi:hypothetical protein DK847_14850 [Aestuariivirga litoralis]|uniref:Amidohydrolase 3 domain-containing protein n=1 Tax=Aestuariivirga litoralis TaxID=2650924 RepID=A0A2W2AQN6_9HYPH|nr:amidohydrolase [Aestuariivirga litoralis]PZF75932.1 hypothetical protein DK847_14850 [Aestuariivirga litoralis]